MAINNVGLNRLEKNIEKQLYYKRIIEIEILIIIMLMSKDLILFYTSYEMILIPIFLLINRITHPRRGVY